MVEDIQLSLPCLYYNADKTQDLIRARKLAFYEFNPEYGKKVVNKARSYTQYREIMGGVNPMLVSFPVPNSQTPSFGVGLGRGHEFFFS